LEGDKGGGKFCFGRAFWVSPSGGAKAQLFHLWRGTKGREFLFGASVKFPPLEGDKGGGKFWLGRALDFPLWRG